MTSSVYIERNWNPDMEEGVTANDFNAVGYVCDSIMHKQIVVSGYRTQREIWSGSIETLQRVPITTLPPQSAIVVRSVKAFLPRDDLKPVFRVFPVDETLQINVYNEDQGQYLFDSRDELLYVNDSNETGDNLRVTIGIINTGATYTYGEISLQATLEIVDRFQKVRYQAGPGGYVSGNDNQSVEVGQDAVQVEAVPHPGNVFVKWNDGSPSPTRHDYGITGPILISAIFAAE